jgi:hypothetical protein
MDTASLGTRLTFTSTNATTAITLRNSRPPCRVIVNVYLEFFDDLPALMNLVSQLGYQ